MMAAYRSNLCGYHLHGGAFHHWQILVLSCGGKASESMYPGLTAHWTAVASDGVRRAGC